MKRCLVAGILLVLSILPSCRKETGIDTSFALYYNGISEICPGTSINVTPTWHGSVPTDFAITRIKHNGEAYQTDCFAVDGTSGTFSIRSSESLPFGKYVVGISCKSEGTLYEYPDAVEINIMKPVPEGIIISPANISVPLGDVLEGKEELPTAKIGTDGSNHVQIKQYILSNIYLNGKEKPEAKDWFQVSRSGEFSIVSPSPDMVPGVYTFDFRLTTYAVGQDAEEGLFRKALRLDVTSAPLSLNFPVKEGKVEKGYGACSAEPLFSGSGDGLRFALKGVKPDNAPGITVDDATGVIKFPETSSVNIGDTYTVSVTATNKYGSKDFDDVYTFSVIAFLHPVTKLSYNNVTDKISGVSVSNKVEDVDGDDVEFVLGELPDGLKGLTIDPATGEVSRPKGTELEPGTWTVTVIARNVKSEVSATFTMEIVPNPYKFTYVRWGNNLGLTPLDDYGNQFVVKASDGVLQIPVLESDIPDGVPVKFKLTQKTNNSNMKMGCTIDSETGTVSAEYQGAVNEKSARCHFGIISVTVGGSSEAAVTKDFPLFIRHDGYNAGYKIEYTPFAFRVNPKTGGRSVTPVITRQDGQPVDRFTLSYRRNIYYYRLGGPQQHKDGRPGDGQDTFMYGVWVKYYSARNVLSPNTGSCSPVSYQGDRNGERGWLGLTACYVDPEDLSMVVNPEKFSDDYGYANGVVSGCMQYNINGIDPVNVGGTECFPILIWLDPAYNK